MANKLREIFSDEMSAGKLRVLVDALEYCIEEKKCSSCTHFIHGTEYGCSTGSGMDCDTGRCPIDTCEDYELNPADLLALRKFRIELSDKLEEGGEG